MQKQRAIARFSDGQFDPLFGSQFDVVRTQTGAAPKPACTGARHKPDATGRPGEVNAVSGHQEQDLPRCPDRETGQRFAG